MRRFQWWTPKRCIQRRSTNSSIHHKNKISYTSLSIHSTSISSSYNVYTPPHQYDNFGNLSLDGGRQHSAISSINSHIHIDAPSYAQYPLQLKLLQSRWFSSNHRGRGNRRNQDPDMRVCQSIDELTQTAYEHISTMSPRGKSAYWATLSKLLKKSRFEKVQNIEQMNHQLNDILGHTLQDINSFGSRDLATVVISLAKIIKNVGGIDGKRISRYGTPQRVLYDLIIGEKEFIFKVLAEPSMIILHKFDARSLSNLIYAYGLAEYVIKFDDDRTLFDVFAEQVISFNNLNEFKPQHLSNMLWAYANVKVPHSQLFDKVGDHIFQCDTLTDFWPQALSNIIWAYVILDVTHPKLFEKIANYIVTLDSLDRYDPQGLSNLLWAYAKSKEPHPKLYKKLADHIVSLEDLKSFDAQALSNIVLAYATSEVQQPMLFEKIANHILALNDLRSFIGQDCSNTVWAYATADESHPMLFKRLADHIIELNKLHDFNPQAIKDIVWSFATAGESNPKLFRNLADEAIKRQHDFIPQEIANFLWAHATNGQVDKHLFSSLVPSVKANLDEYNAQGLVNIAWAYSVANVNAPSIFNNEFINSCLKKEDEFILENLTQIHQWQLWQQEITSDVSFPESFQKRCYEAFISRDPRPSKLQDDVVSCLSSMGLQPQEEVLLNSGYRIDAVVEVNGKQVAVEVDGPSHFIGKSRELTGSTILKHRQVAALDEMKVVSIPYWEWDKLENDSAKKQQYIQHLLGI